MVKVPCKFVFFQIFSSHWHYVGSWNGYLPEAMKVESYPNNVTICTVLTLNPELSSRRSSQSSVLTLLGRVELAEAWHVNILDSGYYQLKSSKIVCLWPALYSTTVYTTAACSILYWFMIIFLIDHDWSINWLLFFPSDNHFHDPNLNITMQY